MIHGQLYTNYADFLINKTSEKKTKLYNLGTQPDPSQCDSTQIAIHSGFRFGSAYINIGSCSGWAYTQPYLPELHKQVRVTVGF